MRCKVSELLLDPENPRLPSTTNPLSQDELVVLLAEDYSLLDVGRSIADNGFFEEEPLAAVPSVDGKGPSIVIEGNRRLASLKLLSDAELRGRLAKKLPSLIKEWTALAQRMASPILEVPVIRYEKREELLTFMGFRHITGVQPWDPLAKAKFISSLIEQYGMDFEQAALRVGSRKSYVRQVYLGYRVYAQARDAGIDVGNVEKSYGVFSRAMSSAPLKAHIGVTASREANDAPSALKRPVPDGKLEELAEFVSWIAGEPGTPAVISDSRQITVLGSVVASAEGLAQLRQSRSLESAYELTDAAQERVLQYLLQAKSKLEMALRDAAGVKITPGISEAAIDCLRLAKTVEETVTNASAT